nr:MAG: hypothetical protein CM15mV30_0870 [uncultured marine virus]
MKEVLTIDELVEPDLIKSMHHEYAHNYYCNMSSFQMMHLDFLLLNII